MRLLGRLTLLVALVAIPLVAQPHPSRSFAAGDFRDAVDVNPDPTIVEVNLKAEEATVELLPGKPTKVWAYNGIVPGPRIVANLGDEIIVHLQNRLPQPTTIHWHGVEAPGPMDGSNISQAPIPPGTDFTYRFKPLTAATYWYHSHINGAEQVERGLYGGLVVRDPQQDDQLGIPAERDRLFILDDALLDDNGQFPPFATDGTALPPKERALQLANGREGNHFLVNGQETPIIDVVAGVPQRWRFVNVANGRFMRLSIPGQTMYRIGGDGGLIEHPEPVHTVRMIPDAADPKRRISDPDPSGGLLLVPGERAEVVITPRGAPGDEITLEWHDFPRGHHRVLDRPDGGLAYAHDPNDGKADPKPLLRLRVVGATDQYKDKVPPDPLRPIERLDTTNAPVVRVPFGHDDPQPDGNVAFWAAQRGDRPLPFDQVTPDDAPSVELGKTYILEVTNLTKMDHPVHLHGTFFQPLETEFVDPTNPQNNRVVPFVGTENKDLIRLPSAPGAHEGAGGKAIVRLAFRYDDTDRKGQVEAFGKAPTDQRSGGWMLHCHNQEHSESGMMTFLQVRTNRPHRTTSTTDP